MPQYKKTWRGRKRQGSAHRTAVHDEEVSNLCHHLGIGQVALWTCERRSAMERGRSHVEAKAKFAKDGDVAKTAPYTDLEPPRTTRIDAGRAVESGCSAYAYAYVDTQTPFQGQQTRWGPKDNNGRPRPRHQTWICPSCGGPLTHYPSNAVL